MHPDKREVARILYDDISKLNKDAQKFIYERSLEYWLDIHTLPFSMDTNEDGEELNVLSVGVGEIDAEIAQLEACIKDLVVPPGMDPFDIAAFHDRQTRQKAGLRLRIKAVQTIKERLKSRCLNYAIRTERELQASNKARSFLEDAQHYVNNYFKAHSEEVYAKLQKSAELIQSSNVEDQSLLLTEVRRSIKAAADYFLSLRESNGSSSKAEQVQQDDYLNRLEEFLGRRFRKSSSRELLKAEWQYLSSFVRRLNDLASKGVHVDVSRAEAQQGLLGLYLFLYNICLRLDADSSRSAE
jgi:hypothetical protein